MRQEFIKPVRVQIVQRATRGGQVFCERCGVMAKTWQVDHTLPDGMRIDKSKPLTAEEGKVLCSGHPESCHSIKTAQDVAAIAKAKRVEAKHIGVKGAKTGLEGRSREEKAAVKNEKTKSAGKTPLAPRSLFRDAEPHELEEMQARLPPVTKMLALPAPQIKKRGRPKKVLPSV